MKKSTLSRTTSTTNPCASPLALRRVGLSSHAVMKSVPDSILAATLSPPPHNSTLQVSWSAAYVCSFTRARTTGSVTGFRTVYGWRSSSGPARRHTTRSNGRCGEWERSTRRHIRRLTAMEQLWKRRGSRLMERASRRRLDH